MRKNAPLAFCIITLLLLSSASYGQTSGGWGICEFTTVVAMNGFDPSGSNFTCKKAFVQATDEHYRWDGTAWVLESSGSNDNIYTVDGTLEEDRTVTMDGNDLTFTGTNDVVIESSGEVGIGTTTPAYELDVRGTADIEDQLYVGPDAGSGSTTTMRLAENYSTNTTTYQLFSSSTITSPTLTGDRHSYGAFFNLINNKTEDVAGGRDSDASAGYFQTQNSGSFTFRSLFGVQGFSETSSTATSDLGSLYGVRGRAYNNTSAGTVSDLFGGDFEARGASGATSGADDAFGVRGRVNAYGMTMDDGIGLYSYVQTNNGSAGDIADAYGVYSRIRVDSDDGGDINFARGGFFLIDRRSGANLIPTAIGLDVNVNDAEEAYGLRIRSDDGDATTNYGIYLDVRNAGTNNYGIWGEEGDWVLDEDGDGTVGGTGAGGDLALGASQDLLLYHDGTDSYMFNNIGDIIITDVGNDDVILQVNGGAVGIGTTSPDAKLDVEGGNVRFSDYGGGTYDTGNETYLLGVEADGDVIEVALDDIDNIYNTDGTLDATRTVTMANNDMLFDMTGTGDFEIRDSGTPVLIVEDTDVGIGEANPNAPLHITETTGTAASASDGTIVLEHENDGGSSSIVFKSSVNENSDYGYIQFSDDGSGNGSTTENGLLELGVINDTPGAYQDDIALMPSGYLGVGTRSPAAKLDVDGGSMRLSDYGGGTYDTGNETYILAVEADGDVVEVDPSTLGGGGGGADNLGNHIATQNIRLSGNWLSNDGGNEGIQIQNDGDVGVGTSTPDARLDVEGGSLRLSDYGGGTYIDTASQSTPADAVYMLGVEADGDIVSMNTAKSAKVFYPPALVIDASTTGTNFTKDLHAEYVLRFGMPDVASTGAPAAIPTYDEDELFYYVTDYDSNVFSNVQIDRNGLMTYNIDNTPADNCSVMNVVFVVK